MIHKVGTDGWISFGRALNNSNPALFPTNAADVFWTFTVAPFWSNLDTSQGGNVSWEIHNISLSHELIETVNNFIHDEYGDVNFNGTWMLLGFWEDVTPSGKSSPVSILMSPFIPQTMYFPYIQSSTFQAVLITNSTQSYAVFTYKCGELSWSENATIGFNVPIGPYKNHPLSDAAVDPDTIACVHMDSVWNNVIYNLQPDGNLVLTTTPEPSDFIGIVSVHLRILTCTVYMSRCLGIYIAIHIIYHTI